MMKTAFEQDDEKCIVRPRSRATAERCLVMPRYRTVKLLVCPICGAQANRAQAKFCAVCGHSLREDYAPLDALRASYNLRQQITSRIISPPKPKEMPKLFDEHRNGAASTAMAFVVYSLVPYLGILFCPGALILGSIGLAVAIRKPYLGGRQTAIYSLLFGTIIFIFQILLWWLLYIIPELNK